MGKIHLNGRDEGVCITYSYVMELDVAPPLSFLRGPRACAVLTNPVHRTRPMHDPMASFFLIKKLAIITLISDAC
jgi:hypothetical protein